MRIDVHTHIWLENNYLETLIAEGKRLKFDKICLNGLGFDGDRNLIHEPLNKHVREAFNKYHDYIIGFGYVRLGWDDPKIVDTLYSEGFKGLKVANPKANYDDKQFYPIYAKAEKYEMPILFHTGIIVRTDRDRYYDVSSARQHPIYLDTIARAFPGLNIIGAHLGIPWHADACMVAQENPNIYFDLSIYPPMNWWQNQTSGFFQRLFYTEDAWEKIVFGTDTSPQYLETALKTYAEILTSAGVSQSVKDKIFGNTMVKLLHL